MKLHLKIIIGIVILLPIVAHLIYAVTVSPATNYYITVDQYAARSANTPVRVGGSIVPGSIRWDNATRTMRFQIAGDNAKVDVVYRGVVPDAFRDGVTAILDGGRSADGTFGAIALTIKCPHQYLPAGM